METNNMLFRAAFLLITTAWCTECAKILGIFPIAGISHHILASKLMKELAEAGHEVTVVSPYPLKDPPKNGKYIDIILDGYAEGLEDQLKEFDLYEIEKQGPVKKFMRMSELFIVDTNKTLHHPKMKELVESKQKFDAVLMEQFINDAHKVYAHIFNCPLILLSTVGPNVWVNPTVGNPQPMSYVPHTLNGDFSRDMPFFARMKNLLFYVIDDLLRHYFVFPKFDDMVHAIYPDAPSIYDLNTNVSLVLLNSHTSIYSALPLVPNMVEIGGYFIDPPKKLPKELQEYMDSAKYGVVYFSMGSNLKSKDMSREQKKTILNVLGKLKQKVIWKFEEDLPGKPQNVMIMKWCPQQDILAHPNLKLFITHGGLLSTTETVYHGVPILAIPVFGDQMLNAARAVANGFGLKLSYHDPDFTEEKLSSLINDLLTNPKYKETVQLSSRLYHDRPMKPKDTLVYWVEYVIRHKGAPHLRVAGIKLPWYKYFMIDVILFIILSFVLILYISKLAIKRLFLGSSKVKTLKKKKVH